MWPNLLWWADSAIDFKTDMREIPDKLIHSLILEGRNISIDNDDIYLEKITTRVLQNLILHKNADQPNA
jgi:hypothetical protein